MAKLAHSSHTEQHTSFDGWQQDWPDVDDIFNFWFFGLRKQGLLPTEADLRDRATQAQWATKLNLSNDCRKVPDWVFFVAGDQKAFKNLWEKANRQQLYDLRLPSSFVSLAFPQPLVAKDIEEGAVMNPYDIGELAVHGLPVSLRASFKDLLMKSEAAFLKELNFEPAFESKAKAKRRIKTAFERWLNVQLDWIDCATQERTNHQISSGDLKNFIRFQCKGEPVRSIVPKLTADDDRSSKQSAIRKMLKRVADRLQLKQRVEPSGRPRKKKNYGIRLSACVPLF